jgi:hypothetical protein
MVVSGTLCLWTLDPDTECRDSLRYPRKSRMCRTTGQTSQASPLNHPASPSMPPTPSGALETSLVYTRLFHHSLISPEQIIVPARPCVNKSLASSDQASSSIQSPYGAAGCQWRPLRCSQSAFIEHRTALPQPRMIPGALACPLRPPHPSRSPHTIRYRCPDRSRCRATARCSTQRA